MLTRRLLITAAALSGLAGVLPALGAQGYPARTVKIVVPFPPGTPSEFVIRALADRLSTKFRQPFIIENRPGGAGGTLGAAAVAMAASDGYTLLASPPGPLVTAAAIYKNLSYDPAALVPVALLFNSPQLLAVHPSVPANALRELVRHAKAHPRALNFASPGYGTQPHLLGEILKESAGIDIVHVPYKSPAAALTDLLGGQVQMYFETSPLILPQAQAGKLRVLAIAGSRRLKHLPDVPTTLESGFPHLLGGFWSGLVAPARTPTDIVEAINAAANEAMRSQQVQAAMETLGASPQLGTPAKFGEFISAETRRWTEIVRTSGIKVH
jgi:tripartite-type tricarboxylate transporter receptor subunit TctC